MMKHAYRTMLLALLAIFALSAITAAAASAAAPEFKPVPTKKKFTSTSGTVTLHWGPQEMVCSSSTATGEITSASTIGKVTITYKKCAGVGTGSCEFHSEGKASGEIVTKALKGELGTVATTEAASGVGMLLLPETGSTWAVIEGPCTGSTRLTGELAGEVTPIGKKQLTSSIVYAASTSGQNITEITIAGKKSKVPTLELFSAAADIETTNTLTFEEALEIT